MYLTRFLPSSPKGNPRATSNQFFPFLTVPWYLWFQLASKMSHARQTQRDLKHISTGMR
jgi:hypothetical protein